MILVFFFSIDNEHQLGSLPAFEQEHVTSCLRSIEWLLRDEHVSLTRHVIPVTSTTLQQVADHVRQSIADAEVSGSAAGDVTASPREHDSLYMHRSVPLLFVFGPDQSYAQFVMVCYHNYPCFIFSSSCDMGVFVFIQV